MHRAFSLLAGLILAVATGFPAHAADDEDLPYWASLTADVVNMRVGPARDYKIAWVYKRKLLPLKVIRRHEGWRLVEDPDGVRGWMLARFLSRQRTAIVRGAPAAMRERPGAGRTMWRAEPGVVGRIDACETGWCKFEVVGRAAWVDAAAIWGEGKP